MVNIPKPPNSTELQNLLRYRVDTDQGKVFNSKGKEVGTIANDGYYRICVTSSPGKQRGIRRCHIIWWAHHKRWPKQEIDHDDRNGLNDSISNLKESTRDANSANRDRPVHDLPAGVHFKPRMKTNPYAAIKTVQGKTFTIGYFPNPELAHQAYTNYKE